MPEFDLFNTDQLTSLIGDLKAHTLDVPREKIYSLFSELGLERNENKHSAFIASLLNPQGSHGCGDVFLRLFIEHVVPTHLRNYINYNQQTRVIREYNTGNGFIDILVESKPEILIENKIDAVDQNQQLRRYRESFDKGVLLYLTLDGHDAAEWSVQGPDNIRLVEGNNYHRVSYQEHIIRWIQACIEKTSEKPFLKQVLELFLETVRKITGAKMEEKEFNQLLEIFKANGAYFNHISELNSLINNFRFQLSRNLLVQIEQKLTLLNYSLDSNYLNEDFGLTKGGISMGLYPKALPCGIFDVFFVESSFTQNNENTHGVALCIGFRFEQGDTRSNKFKELLGAGNFSDWLGPFRGYLAHSFIKPANQSFWEIDHLAEAIAIKVAAFVKQFNEIKELIQPQENA